MKTLLVVCEFSKERHRWGAFANRQIASVRKPKASTASCHPRATNMSSARVQCSQTSDKAWCSANTCLRTLAVCPSCRSAPAKSTLQCSHPTVNHLSTLPTGGRPFSVSVHPVAVKIHDSRRTGILDILKGGTLIGRKLRNETMSAWCDRLRRYAASCRGCSRLENADASFLITSCAASSRSLHLHNGQCKT